MYILHIVAFFSKVSLFSTIQHAGVDELLTNKLHFS